MTEVNSHPSTVCRRHVDHRTGPEEDQNLQEGSEQVIRDEGHGIGKENPRDAHSLGSDKEVIVAVTEEVRDKGAPEVQHGGCETGRVDTASKLQIVRKT